MQATARAYNPFALLLDPQAVIAAVERSERLGRLSSRICRPLDRLTGPVGTDDAALQDIVSSDLDDLDLAQD